MWFMNPGFNNDFLNQISVQVLFSRLLLKLLILYEKRHPKQDIQIS